MTFTEADLTYIRANFVTLEALCAGRRETPEDVLALVGRRLLPQPSYVLDDGTPMFPADHLQLMDDAGGADEPAAHFAARHAAASRCPDELDADWEGYLSGVYGVCLRTVTPETIVRKNALVSSLCELLVLARPGSAEWREALRTQVDELDGMEREFSPDHDRHGRFGRPPTRDLLIDGARARFPEVFAPAPV